MDWHYENGRIYATDEKGGLMCEATYTRTASGSLNIEHTFVDPGLRGQGIAGKMMEVVAEHFRKEGQKVSATCSYAQAWLSRHEEYSDITS